MSKTSQQSNETSNQKKPNEESREPQDYTSTVPKSFSSNAITKLQRTIGNRNTSRLLGRATPPLNIQRAWPFTTDTRTNKEKITDAIKSRSASDVRDIDNIAEADEGQRLTLIEILLDQTWVDPLAESKINEIWRSFGSDGMNKQAEKHPELWEKSYNADAEPISLDQTGGLFKLDVENTALQYLNHNENFVEQQMQTMGLPSDPDAAVVPGTTEQNKRLQETQEASSSIAKLQEAQEKSRTIVVGYKVKESPGGTDSAYYDPVLFDPFHPPSNIEHPKDDNQAYSFVPYETAKEKYDNTSEKIRELIDRYPMSFALARDGDSGATASFADAKDPQVAREWLAKAMQELLSDIRGAKSKLGGELDPFDLLPLHQRFYDGEVKDAKPHVNWNLFVNKWLAKRVTANREVNTALAAFALDSVTALMFVLAPFTGGGSLFVELAALSAMAGKASISTEQYESMAQAAKTNIKPGTQIVSPEQVDHAKMMAEADKVALALATLATIATQVGGLISKLGITQSKALLALFDDATKIEGLLKHMTGAEIEKFAAEIGDHALFNRLVAKYEGDTLKHYGSKFFKDFKGIDEQTIKHLSEMDKPFTQKKGISGCHDDANFLAEFNKPPENVSNTHGLTTRGKIHNTKAHPTQQGIQTHEYSVWQKNGNNLQLDAHGNPMLRNDILKKTTIKDLANNPTPWVDSANEAVEDAIRSKSFPQSGAKDAGFSGKSKSGLEWRGYAENGRVSTIFMSF